MMASPPLLTAIESLVKSLDRDENSSGGLLSRQSLRLAGELRALVALERRRRGEPEPAQAEGLRQPKGPLL